MTNFGVIALKINLLKEKPHGILNLNIVTYFQSNMGRYKNPIDTKLILQQRMRKIVQSKPCFS